MNQTFSRLLLLVFIVVFLSFTPGQTGIVVSPTTLNFGSVPIGFDSVQVLKVYNIGGTTTLNVTNITTNNAAYTVNITSFSLAVGDSQAVNVTFTPANPIAYNNFLYVYSNDPQNPIVPVILRGTGIELPVISVYPDTFDVALGPGELFFDTLIIRNTGVTPLNYTIGIDQYSDAVAGWEVPDTDRPSYQQRLNAVIRKRSSPSNQELKVPEDYPSPGSHFQLPDVIDLEEIFGSTASPFSGTLRDRGNVFQVTTTTTLREHKLYLNITTSTPIYFFVYQGTNWTGSFTKINEVFIASSGTGQGFYSSGPISVSLQAGSFYYIGASWQGNATYYRGTEITPIPCSFGFLETGIAGNIAGGYPPTATANNTYTTRYNPYYCAIVTGAGGGSGWLSADPDTGMVMPGDSQIVDIIFNSAGLLGGDYNADLVISSNDPATPELRVGTHLFVIGEPLIAVAPDSLFYPDLIVVGVTDTLNLTVYNVGNGVLDISGIVSSNPSFTVSSSAFSVPPYDSLGIQVFFTPVAAGTQTGILTISSNDATHPTIPVYAEGMGIEAPVMVLSTDSLDVIVPSDTTITQIVTISNTGAGPLFWNLEIEGVFENTKKINVIGQGPTENNRIISRGQVVQLSELQHLITPVSPQISFNQLDPGDKGMPYTSTHTGLSPVAMTRGEEIFGSMQNVFGPAGARGRGNMFYCSSATNLIEHRLYLNMTANSDMQFVVYEGTTAAGSYTLINVSQIANSGTGAGWYSSGPINVPLVAGRYYMIYPQWTQPANYYTQNPASPYPVPASFGQLIAGIGWHVAPTYSVPPAATQSGAGYVGDPVAYYQTIVTGAGADWLTADITGGTVAPGGSTDVTFTFNPAGLLGGDYYADVTITSNDPVTPMTDIGVHMFVDAEPNISTNPDSLFFRDDLFVGASETRTLYVVNDAPGVLDVTDITSSLPIFTVNTTNFSIPAFDSVGVEVTFTPIMTGTFTGTLQIACNDPDTPVYEVFLRGSAIPAPVAIINASFQNPVQVFPDDSVDVFINIGNSGGSPLLWSATLSDAPVTEKRIKPQVHGPTDIPVAAEISPDLQHSQGGVQIEAIWDIQFSFDVVAASGAAGNAGSEFDGTYYYTTRWASNLIHKYTLAGVLVEAFSIPGVTGLRDLAFDGTYMYGGAASTTIFMMDFVSKTLIGTIPSPVNVRNIAYDSDNDGLWVADWTTTLYLVSRTGTTLASIPAATHGVTSVYGSAYDNWSDGGPYLWLFSQGAGAGAAQFIYQINLTTGTQTGVSHEVKADFPLAGTQAIAGGLFTAEGIVSGKVSIGGVLQGTPDIFFVYELAEAAPPWIILMETGGSISPGDQFDIPVRVYGIAATGDSAYVIISTNDPSLPLASIEVIRDVTTGIAGPELLPVSFDIAQNYPNPFNPSTTFKYQLPLVSEVKLVIYNVLGQQIRTLVNNRMDAGYHSVVWDGRNDVGQTVSSGVYIYRFEAGDFTRTLKMMLLK